METPHIGDIQMSEAIDRFKTIGAFHQWVHGCVADSRAEWREALALVSDAEWAEEIKKIKGKQLRSCVAGVVWWDINKDEEKFPLLTALKDGYKRTGKKIGKKELRNALVELGYPQCITKERATEQ